MTPATSPERPGRFDAVLMISFGGPQGRQEIAPFLANVLRDRKVSPERLEEVVHHYELFDGHSPLTALTRRQAEGLTDRLKANGVEVPVYIGMRNWHPFLTDTLREMAGAGIQRAIGFITAAHHSYSSCTQYRENVIEARRELIAHNHPDIEITYVDSWYDHPGFINSNARHVRDALVRLEPDQRQGARLIFSTHSIPTSMARVCRYAEQLETSARQVAEKLGRQDWALVYQSRSGRPQDPWMEPDICDYLREEHKRGLRAVVICPIGFVCDHVEVLYDLDHEAGELCAELNLPMVRAETANDDPEFLDMIADVVMRKMEQFRHGPPLPLVGAHSITDAPGRPGRPAGKRPK